MTTILQMNQEDLRNEIRNCFRESIEEIKSIPIPPPQPDRMNFKEACEFTDQSDSQMYKLTMLDEIPKSHYGKRLVFSRKALIEWMENRTVSKISDSKVMDEILAKSAKKHLNKK